MRLLNGILGAFAALCISQMLIASVTGDFDQVATPHFFIGTAILALITADIISIVERSTWGWASYCVAGIATAGVALAALLLVWVMLVQFIYHIPTASHVIWVSLLLAAASGLFTGVGYRVLSGARAAE